MNNIKNIKNLLIISNHGCVEIGGVESFLFGWLSHVDTKKINCILCLPPGEFSNKIQKKYNNIRVITIKGLGSKMKIKDIIFLLKTLLKFVPNIVVIQGFGYEQISMYLSRLFTKNIYTFIHSPFPLYELNVIPSRHFFGLFKGIGLWKKKKILRNKAAFYFSKSVVCVSNDTKNSYRPIAASSIKKFITSSIWVDTNKFRPNQFTRLKLREKYNIPSNALVFIFAGRINEGKRVDRMLGAFLHYSHKYNNSINKYLVIIGDGPLMEKHKQKSIRYSLKNVIWLGKRDDVCEILNIGDIFILPSDNEGFGFVVLESMATGLFPITTDVSDFKHIFYKYKVGEVSEKNAFCLARKMDSVSMMPLESLKEKIRNFVVEKYDALKVIKSQFDFIGIPYIEGSY